MTDLSLPLATNFEEKSGTKAEVNAPSANKLRNKFGSLKETKKASETMPAPKKLAIIISRTKPVKRLIIVKPPKVAIDLTKDINKVPKKLSRLNDLLRNIAFNLLIKGK
jgi:hypothetical protein